MRKIFYLRYILIYRFLHAVCRSSYLLLADGQFCSPSIVLNLNGRLVKKRDPASCLEWRHNGHNAEPFPKKCVLIFAAGGKHRRIAR